MSSKEVGLSENSGTLFWGPYNKDPTVQGTGLGSPIFGNPNIETLTTFPDLVRRASGSDHGLRYAEKHRSVEGLGDCRV